MFVKFPGYSIDLKLNCQQTPHRNMQYATKGKVST